MIHKIHAKRRIGSLLFGILKKIVGNSEICKFQSRLSDKIIDCFDVIMQDVKVCMDVLNPINLYELFVNDARMLKQKYIK